MGKNVYIVIRSNGRKKIFIRIAVRNSLTTNPPILDYTLQEMEILAKQVIETSVAVPGVQTKIIDGGSLKMFLRMQTEVD